ncbi:MAG: alpha/beta fold hydrolase [Planctomycetota bacterium]|jgi:esterase/lipase superfamily enzyme
MERHDDSFQSRVLGRETKYLWFGHAGRALVMFPTSTGKYNENEDFGLIDALAGPINEGRLQVCCIESVNNETWANDDAPRQDVIRGHDNYDRFLSEEMFPMVAHRSGRDDVIVYGASLGGYHAANFAARHPEQVSRCIALSGLFDNRSMLDGYFDDLCYYHNPACSIPNMDEDWVNRLRSIEWVVATGENDSLVEQTRNFSRILRDKGIEVHSEIWPGVFGHDWPYWKQHLPRFVG